MLADVGYDRLTMDAVANRAKASKATLYRRWTNKVSLVIEALQHTKAPPEPADTGSLRGDLQDAFCGMGGLADPDRQWPGSRSVLTAIARDADFAEAFRTRGDRPQDRRLPADLASAPGSAASSATTSTSTLLEPALAGIILHRVFLMGEQPDADLITRVIDQIILPAATRGTGAQPRPTHKKEASMTDVDDARGSRPRARSCTWGGPSCSSRWRS